MVFVAVPATVQLVRGNDRLAEQRTVKDAPGVLVKANCKTPPPSIRAAVRAGGVPIIGAACVTAMLWPSKVMLALRLEPEVLAGKEKLTTPLVIPVIVSHDWLLTGANGASRLSVAGRTTGKESLPAAPPSNLGVGSTKARGSSSISSLKVSAM